MMEEVKKQFSSTKLLVSLLIIAVSLYLLQIGLQVLANFSDVFIILIFAWLIGFVLEPPTDYVAKKLRLKKVYGAAIVYVIFIGLMTAFFIYLIPTVVAQLQSLLILVPKYAATTSPTLTNRLMDLITGNISNSIALIPSIANFLLYAVLTVIISFYFIVDKDKINKEIYNLAPDSWHKEMKITGDVIDTTFASFLRVQLLFGIMSGVTTWIVLAIFHVDFGLTAAILAGILTLIPLLGPGLALIPPLIVAIVFASNVLIPIVILLLIAQQIIFNVIGPRLLGHAFNLHPIVVLLSFVLGYKVAGNIGALLGIPVLGILAVVFHRLYTHLLHHEEVKT